MPVAVILACHCGELAAAEKAVKPFKEFGPPVMDMLGPQSYSATNMMLDAGFPKGALNYWKSSFLGDLSDAAIEILVEKFSTCPSPMSGLLLEHLHGAATRVEATATAFPHRHRAIACSLYPSGWTQRRTTQHRLGARGVRRDAATYGEWTLRELPRRGGR